MTNHQSRSREIHKQHVINMRTIHTRGLADRTAIKNRITARNAERVNKALARLKRERMHARINARA